MNNLLFNSLNGLLGNGVNQGSQNQSPQDLQSQFNEFKKTVQGDPKAIVDQLRASGQMSDAQFNQFFMLANMLRGQLK